VTIRVGKVHALVLLSLTLRVLNAQQYNFRYFGVAEGLTDLTIRQIYQDHTGFLWVSTEQGIFRFDGERFEPFGSAQGMPATSGVSFGDAPDGSLLVGGDQGLFHLSGNRFEKVPLAAGSVNASHGIQSDGKGHTFIGADSGLFELVAVPGRARFDARRIPQVPGTSSPVVDGVSVDGEVVWYGCGLELCRMDPNGTTFMGPENGLPGLVWELILKDAGGNLWVRGKNAGLFVLPNGQSKFRRPDSPVLESGPGLPALDADKRMLLPANEGSLLMQTETGWQKIGRSAGLRGKVYTAFEDRQHSLWIGLAGRGLARWHGYREWENYTTESGLASDAVNEILPMPNRTIWAATEAGLMQGTRLESGISWKNVTAAGAIPVHALQMAANGDIWIGSETRGAARIDAHTGEVEWFGDKQGLTGKAAFKLRFDRQHQLWAATESGLFVAYPPYRNFSRVSELPATRFWAVAEGPDGSLWAGGADGLFVNSNGKWKTCTRTDGLSNQEVIALAAGANGKVWIAYRDGGGIDRVRLTEGGIAIEKGVQRPGTDGITRFLEFDNSGRLWAGTGRGVDVWDGSRWSHYDTSDGLVWDVCNLNAFAAEADGTVWIGTGGGLSRFRPRLNWNADSPPQVVFTRLIMGTEDVLGRHNLLLRTRSRALTVRFSALNTAHEGNVAFRYRLLPGNSAWTETTHTELEFAQLAPGRYGLEVEARESDQAWSSFADRFSFEILRPWYQTWWFLGLCVPASLLAAAVGLRMRMMAAADRENELVRIVEEKTLDLRRANEDLLRLSSMDPLTGIANRRVFDEAIGKECARLKRVKSPVSLLLLDIDHFKTLNDSQGHLRGDQYLVLIGAALSRLARRETDLAARYGGEEFALILPNTDAAGAAGIAESIRMAIASLELPNPESPVAPFLTVSMGLATAECRVKPEELIASADRALFEAKKSGRNRVMVAHHDPAARLTTAS